MKITFISGLLLLCLCACGGGGGNVDDDDDDGGNTGGNYSVSVNTQALHFDIPFGGFADPEAIQVTFQGAGLLVAYAPDANQSPPLNVYIEDVTASSASVVVHLHSGFTQLHEQHITTLRIYTGDENGEHAVYKEVAIYAQQQDGISVEENPYLNLNAAWGDDASTQLFVNTIQKHWTATSDFPGLIISPTEQTGGGTITISYDPALTPPSTDSANIVITADSGETFTRTVDFSLSVPSFLNTETEFAFPNHALGQSLDPLELNLAFSNGIEVPWSAQFAPWLSANMNQGISGQHQLSLHVDASNFPESSQLLQSDVTVSFDLAGDTVVRNYNITFPYEQFFYQASRQAFAFSDYGTANTHQGDFYLNTDLEPSVQVSSSAEWVTIDEISGRKVRFHLDTGSLDNNFHEAQITIAKPGSNAMVAETVNIGYYKSDLTLPNQHSQPWNYSAFAVSDKLGPWFYVVNRDPESNETGTILHKYNYLSGEIDKSLEIPNFKRLAALTLSDDGKTLYGLGYNNDGFYGEYVRIDLTNFETYQIQRIDGPQSPTVMRYTQLNGKEMVSDGSSWFDAITGNIIYYSGDRDGYYSQTGDFILGPYSYTPGGIIHTAYSYSYLSNSITPLGSDIVNAEGIAESIFVAANEQWLTLASVDNERNYSQFTSFNLSRDEVGSPVLTEYNSSSQFEKVSWYAPYGVVTSDGRTIVIMSAYTQAEDYDWQQALRVFDKDFNLLDETLHSWYDEVAVDQLRLSADEKSVSYFLRDWASRSSTMLINSLE